MQPPLSPKNDEEKEELLYRIKRSAIFQRVFRGEDGEFVLAELKKQIRGFDPNPYAHAYNAGMRFWWDFIQNAIEGDVEKAREVLNAKTEVS